MRALTRADRAPGLSSDFARSVKNKLQTAPFGADGNNLFHVANIIPSFGQNVYLFFHIFDDVFEYFLVGTVIINIGTTKTSIIMSGN